MKKNVKKYIINVFLLVIVLLTILDYEATFKFDETSWICANQKNKIITYFKHYAELHNYSTSSQNHLKKDNANPLLDNYSRHGENRQNFSFRPIENQTADKSIIIFGSDYAYGKWINERETLSVKLGELLPNYRIYNRARKGWSTSSMLYQLEHKTFSEIPNVECVLYIFNSSHFLRNESSMCVSVPYYKLDKNNKLYFQKSALKYIEAPLFIKYQYAYWYKYYTTGFVTYDLANHNCYKVRLTKAIIKLSKRFAEYRFPGAKFVVLRYDDDSSEPYNWVFEELKKEGIIVVSFKELVKKSSYRPDYFAIVVFEPTPKAWNDLTPALVKYLQDKGCLKNQVLEKK